MSPRVVTLDIETAPLESYHWGLWDQNIGLDQVNSDWTILAYSAKWLGEKGIHYRDTGGHGRKKVRDDRRKQAGSPNVEAARLESILLLHVGALQEIRKEAKEMHGGWRARVLAVCSTMLGDAT